MFSRVFYLFCSQAKLSQTARKLSQTARNYLLTWLQRDDRGTFSTTVSTLCEANSFMFSHTFVFSDCQNNYNIILYFIISIHACSFVLIFVHHRCFVFCLYLSPKTLSLIVLTGKKYFILDHSLTTISFFGMVTHFCN